MTVQRQPKGLQRLLRATPETLEEGGVSMATNHQYRKIRTFHVSHGQNRRNQNTCHSSINDGQGRADTCAFHASSIRAKTLLSHLGRYQGNFLQLAELFFPLGVELTGYQSHGDKATCPRCRGKHTLWWWDVLQDGVLGVGAAFAAQGLCNSGPEGHFAPNAPLSSSCSAQLVVVTQC